MRLLSISGGIILAAGISLVGGALVQPADKTPGENSNTVQSGDVPRIVLQTMSWWYFTSQISRTQLSSTPATPYVVIDLRQPEDFARSHLPGAVNVPADQIIAQLGAVAPDHDQNILLYGYDETHSVRTLATLRLLAYTHVVHLKDGWQSDNTPFNSKSASTNHSATMS